MVLKMLRGMNQMFGYAIEARDGRLGKVEDFYFDDFVWRVRYLVAETGGWLTRQDVLIVCVRPSPVLTAAPFRVSGGRRPTQPE